MAIDDMRSSLPKYRQKGTTVPIWKLIPIDKTSDHWRASTHKDEVIIRATSEKEARAKAASEFLISIHIGRGEWTIWGSPWEQSSVVRCQRLEDSPYEEKGPVAILYTKI
jgi:hypothetical protein